MRSKGWVVTRYDDVVTCLKSEHVAKTPQASTAILNSDRHLKMRRIAARAFSNGLCASQSQSIESIINELLVTNQKSFDAISHIAGPLPIRVAAAMTGVDFRDMPRFKQWSRYLSVTSDRDSCSENYYRDVMRARSEMHEYWRSRSANFRGKSELLTAMAEVEESGERLTEEELYINASMILVVGNETSTNAIGNAIFALSQNPSEMERLRQFPECIDNAVEEMLRFDGPSQFIPRVAHSDFELNGRAISRGESLFIGLASAGHDASINISPARFDVRRASIRHVAFGLGTHYCLAAALARLIIKLTILSLIERCKVIRVNSHRMVRLQNYSVRGFSSLPVELCQ